MVEVFILRIITIDSIKRANRIGDIGQPCLVPKVSLKPSQSSTIHAKDAVAISYSEAIVFVNWDVKPIAC